MARENAQTKGRRYLTEGRLNIHRVQRDPFFEVVAYCKGDSGNWYSVNGYPDGHWSCDCEARTDQCSHLVALRLVTVRPIERQAVA